MVKKAGKCKKFWKENEKDKESIQKK